VIDVMTATCGQGQQMTTYTIDTEKGGTAETPATDTAAATAARKKATKAKPAAKPKATNAAKAKPAKKGRTTVGKAVE
jgi:hypothetical protein